MGQHAIFELTLILKDTQHTFFKHISFTMQYNARIERDAATLAPSIGRQVGLVRHVERVDVRYHKFHAVVVALDVDRRAGIACRR